MARTQRGVPGEEGPLTLSAISKLPVPIPRNETVLSSFSPGPGRKQWVWAGGRETWPKGKHAASLHALIPPFLGGLALQQGLPSLDESPTAQHC